MEGAERGALFEGRYPVGVLGEKGEELGGGWVGGWVLNGGEWREGTGGESGVERDGPGIGGG